MERESPDVYDSGIYFDFLLWFQEKSELDILDYIDCIDRVVGAVGIVYGCPGLFDRYYREVYLSNDKSITGS